MVDGPDDHGRDLDQIVGDRCRPAIRVIGLVDRDKAEGQTITALEKSCDVVIRLPPKTAIEGALLAGASTAAGAHSGTTRRSAWATLSGGAQCGAKPVRLPLR